MPPTNPAAKKMASGRICASQSSVADWSNQVFADRRPEFQISRWQAGVQSPSPSCPCGQRHKCVCLGDGIKEVGSNGAPGLAGRTAKLHQHSDFMFLAELDVPTRRINITIT